MARKKQARNKPHKIAPSRATLEEKAPKAGLPPNSVLLSDLPFEPPKPGMVVWTAVYNLGGFADVLPEFNIPEYKFGVGSNGEGRRGLWYQVWEGDLQTGDPSDWAFIWMKMSYLVETMSILTIGNLWIGDKLWGNNKLVWQRPRGVPLVSEKEYSSEEASIASMLGDVEVGVATVNLQYHIAMNVPRAWGYHHTGCYLLRTSFPGHEYYADALLNFFKVGEMVTARMYQVKPHLKDIKKATAELDLNGHFSDADIANFYRVRSRDAAHDWLTAEQVSREDAVDCKMWAESMLIHHWRAKGTDVLLMQRKGRGLFPAPRSDWQAPVTPM